jgi:hypothetical protein
MRILNGNRASDAVGRPAFASFLRSGRWIAEEDQSADQQPSERKYNHNHDPRNGRFTFAPGGGGSAAGFIRRSGGETIKLGGDASVVRKPSRVGRPRVPIRTLPPEPPPSISQGAGAAPNLPKRLEANGAPRPGVGHNGGPALRDNAPLRALFPALGAAEPGVVIAAAAVLSNPIAPAASLIASLNRSTSEKLIRDIKSIDPNYRFESLREPITAEGWSNQINQLQMDRAVAAYRVNGDHSFLQAETVRFVQGRVDLAYDLGVRLYSMGKLPSRLSKNEAIGNFVDWQVRYELKGLYRSKGISIEHGKSIQVNRRAYNNPEGSYRVPDSRVGRLAIDVSLTAKTRGSAQIRGFFRSDFQPEAVIIIRPSQLGPNHTYLIARPKGL